MDRGHDSASKIERICRIYQNDNTLSGKRFYEKRNQSDFLECFCGGRYPVVLLYVHDADIEPDYGSAGRTYDVCRSRYYRAGSDGGSGIAVFV